MSVAHSPNPVSDGLIFYCDTHNTKSCTSGSTITDMINGVVGTNYNASLVAGPPTAYYYFNGSNSYIGYPNSTILDVQNPTVEVWVRTSVLSQNGFWFEKGTVNTQYSLFTAGTNIYWRQYISGIVDQTTVTASYLTSGVWAQVVGTYTSGTRNTYVNGVLATTDTQAGLIATNANGMIIGAYNIGSGSGAGGGYWFDGNIAIVKVYNRNLTATEVRRNFTALRGRFSI